MLYQDLVAAHANLPPSRTEGGTRRQASGLLVRRETTRQFSNSRTFAAQRISTKRLCNILSTAPPLAASQSSRAQVRQQIWPEACGKHVALECEQAADRSRGADGGRRGCIPQRQPRCLRAPGVDQTVSWQPLVMKLLQS